MGARDRVDDRKAEADAADGAVAGRVGAAEALEDAVERLLRNPATAVGLTSERDLGQPLGPVRVEALRARERPREELTRNDREEGGV